MQSNPFDRKKHRYKNEAFTELGKDAVRFFNGTPVLLAEKIGHKLIKILDIHTLKIPVVKSPIVPLFRQERSDLLNTLSASASP